MPTALVLGVISARVPIRCGSGGVATARLPGRVREQLHLVQTDVLA